MMGSAVKSVFWAPFHCTSASERASFSGIGNLFEQTALVADDTQESREQDPAPSTPPGYTHTHTTHTECSGVEKRQRNAYFFVFICLFIYLFSLMEKDKGGGNKKRS